MKDFITFQGTNLATGGSFDLVFDNGNLNSASIPYPTIFTGDINDSTNFLSNPYPSAIDTDMLLGDNAAINEVYFGSSNRHHHQRSLVV